MTPEKRTFFCKANEEEYIREVSSIIKDLLVSIGEDPEREGLKDTPKRVAKMFREIFHGYCEEKEPKITIFSNKENYDEIILDEGYYYSNCEHHLQPFFGKAFIAYIPDKNMIGLSKLGRILDFYASRLQVQERLTQEVATYIDKVLAPKGVAVVLQGRHLCREIKGIKKFGALMTTSHLLGQFRTNAKTRREFMSLIQNRLSTEDGKNYNKEK